MTNQVGEWVVEFMVKITNPEIKKDIEVQNMGLLNAGQVLLLSEPLELALDG